MKQDEKPLKRFLEFYTVIDRMSNLDRKASAKRDSQRKNSYMKILIIEENFLSITPFRNWNKNIFGGVVHMIKVIKKPPDRSTQVREGSKNKQISQIIFLKENVGLTERQEAGRVWKKTGPD